MIGERIMNTTVELPVSHVLAVASEVAGYIHDLTRRRRILLWNPTIPKRWKPTQIWFQWQWIILQHPNPSMHYPQAGPRCFSINSLRSMLFLTMAPKYLWYPNLMIDLQTDATSTQNIPITVLLIITLDPQYLFIFERWQLETTVMNLFKSCRSSNWRSLFRRSGQCRNARIEKSGLLTYLCLMEPTRVAVLTLALLLRIPRYKQSRVDD